MKIDAKQIKLIHIAKSQLGLDDENYRAIISGQTQGKKTSSIELTYAEADAVINYMIRQGFRIKEKYVSGEQASKRSYRYQGKSRRAVTTSGNLYCLASHDQLKMVNALAGQIQWRVEDGFHRWMKKYIKIDRIKTEEEASAVIEGLKGMLENQVQGSSPKGDTRFKGNE